MKAVVAGGALLVVALACTPDAERCRRIYFDQLSAQLYDEQEIVFQTRLVSNEWGDLGAATSAADSDRVRRIGRAVMAAEFRRQLRGQYPSDSVFLADFGPVDPAQDSAEPTPRMPPRPSEIAWHAEHCYRAQAR